jgi:cell division protein FtsW
MMMRRADRSLLSQWWWTIDRFALALVFILMAVGLIVSFAASPSVARDLRMGNEFHFVLRQAIFLIPAIGLVLVVSFLNERMIRRLALLLFLAGCALIFATLFVGTEIKGATRWISIAGFTLQPSEITKPAFVVLTAWLFAQRNEMLHLHVGSYALALYASFAILLVLQPDIGQTMLISMVWCGMFFLAGLSWLWIFMLISAAICGLGAAYLFLPHVTKRIDRFIDPSSGDTYQVDRAMESFINGGWFGQGPGEGTVKRLLPDSHTDFIFAVIGEEFGILACLLIVMLFSVLVIKGFSHAFSEENMFRKLAVAGLTMLIGFQAAINMGVNLQVLPAKGMTLPFISYGGSSLLSASLALGMILALTRRRPKPKQNIQSHKHYMIKMSDLAGSHG